MITPFIRRMLATGESFSTTTVLSSSAGEERIEGAQRYFQVRAQYKKSRFIRGDQVRMRWLEGLRTGGAEGTLVGMVNEIYTSYHRHVDDDKFHASEIMYLVCLGGEDFLLQNRALAKVFLWRIYASQNEPSQRAVAGCL